MYLYGTHIQSRTAHGALHRLTSYFSWSLDLFIHVPFHLPVWPCGASNLSYNNCHISVPSGTHLHLSEVKHLRVNYPRVNCLAQSHNIDTTMSQRWEGRNMIFLLKSCTHLALNSRDRQRLIAKWYALTIVPRPLYNHTVDKTLSLRDLYTHVHQRQE